MKVHADYRSDAGNTSGNNPLILSAEELAMENTNHFENTKSGSPRPTLSLQQCARNEDVEGLQKLLSYEDVARKVNGLDENGMSALHYAAKANNIHAVTVLVMNGHADCKVRDDEGATPLHYAARKKQNLECKDTAMVVELLTKYCDVNIRDKYMSTPLHFATMRGNVAAARALLSCPGVLVNCKDQLGCTPLHEAATYNQVAVADLLIKSGARISANDNEKCSPLHLAAIEGNTDMARLLVNNCDPSFLKALIDSKDKDDTQALHYAIEAHSMAIVELMVSNGAAANAPCRIRSTGCTPLHLASIAGDREIASYLLSHGALIDALDNKHSSPLHKVAEFECVEVAEILLKSITTPIDTLDSDNYTPLMTAVAYGSDEIVVRLLQEGANVSTTEKDDKNLIFVAAEFEQMESLQILLKHIRDTEYAHLVNGVDRFGNSPLHAVAATDDLACLKLLLDNGADMTAKNENEETPFIIASQNGQIRIVEEILRRNEKVVNDEDEYSDTPLHAAAANGHLGVAKILVEYGAEKEARNEKSRTPLDLAAAAGHAMVAKFLLEEDVSPNPQDKEMVTPLHLASRNGHDRVVQVLIDGNADIAAVDISGRNCLDIAIEHGQKDVISTILNSKYWHTALANENRLKFGYPRITPLRRLLMRSPELAPLALSQCVTYGPENSAPNDPERFAEFNYDFLDDTYTDYEDLRTHTVPPLVEDGAQPAEHIGTYCTDNTWIKVNHPLSILVSQAKKENETLIGHPVILGLIRHKWKMARIFYFMFLAYYAVFLGLITAYLLKAEFPPGVNETDCSLGDHLQSSFEVNAKYGIWTLAVIGIVLELFQIAAQRSMYFDLLNMLDWYCYLSAILIVIDFNSCRLREPWQWQMGAFTLLFIWIDMMIFLRRLPGLGLYVVMIVEILSTFLKFFVVFFLFIVAFALSFFLLAQNMDAFATPFYSIVKTWVMMLGEMDFGDIFHDDLEPPPYQASLYALFVVFLVLMAIIINNLLVGLAVDDVNGLREHAKVVKLKMQIELALDIELALPKSLRRAMATNIRRDRLYLNQEGGACWHLFYKVQKLIEGPLLCYDTIARVARELEQEDDLPELMAIEQRLKRHLLKNTRDIRDLGQKMDRMERLLQGIKTHLDNQVANGQN